MSERRLEHWNEEHYGKQQKELSMVQVGLCGGFSGIGVGLWLTPIEYVKCQMQIQNDMNVKAAVGSHPPSGPTQMYGNTWHCFRHIVQTHPRRLFNGLTPTLFREVPGTCIFFITFEYSLQYLNNLAKKNIPNSSSSSSSSTRQELFHTLISGGLAGVVFWLTIYPFDTVKTQQQLHLDLSHRSMFSLLKHRWQTNGLAKGLYPGFALTIPRAILSNSTLLWVHKYSKILLTDLEIKYDL
ncbi:hypothetical protein RFI_05207 [Reticulomyxa filosa]|uniref:Mitochondrial carrier protein n=1 Tax=Reticulomyxa filosa TaxID=46433 RepID=X6P027_RETFI|nr:hypothetical protein RFI_05207 [Reticulomyxa filosa]|eukprot:ETO31910.1 hypothetical protein RFI_05207 [Reticulomyxa filosa]